MPLTRKVVKPLACVAVVAAGCAGCGGDDEKASNEKQATSRAAAPAASAAPVEPAGPDVKKLRCSDVELGHTSTDAIYLVSALSRAAGVDSNTAAKTLDEVCRDARPRTKAYAAALKVLAPSDSK